MLKTLLLLFVIFLLQSCSEVNEFKGIKFRQYADFVIDYSSQYSATSWSANRALGKENVFPEYGDYANAWAASTPNNEREYLVLGFDTLQTIHTIDIYETFNPGAVDSIFIRKAETEEWIRVYSKPAVIGLPEESRIFSVYMLETTFLVDAIRIALNSAAVDGYNEIDAVAISGQRSN